MAIGPRAEDLPRIRLVLILFRISAAFTGVFLILLLIFWITRYTIGDLGFAPETGALGFYPKELLDEDPGQINLTTMLLIVHGWLYVAYLLLDFALWRLVRYPFTYFLLVALGGVVPFLSFWYEYGVPREVKRRTAHLRKGAGQPAPDPAGASA